MIKVPRPAMWALVIFLTVVFVLSGFSKLAGPSSTRWAERFARWGYAPHAAGLVGILEILGGLSLLIPPIRRAAAATLGGLMIGAVATHLIHGEFLRVIPPLVLGGIALLVYASRRGS